MSALGDSQDEQAQDFDGSGRVKPDGGFDSDSVAIGKIATAARAKLADQLRAAGRADTAVEAAFRAIPRHTFLPEMGPAQAYHDVAVVIRSDGDGLPVSASTQPAMMAIMLSQLELAPGHRVLEVGTGTGYNAALIAHIVGCQRSVVTVDVVPELVGQARMNLAAAGYGRVTVVCGDGAAGVPDHALSYRITGRTVLGRTNNAAMEIRECDHAIWLSSGFQHLPWPGSSRRLAAADTAVRKRRGIYTVRGRRRRQRTGIR